ncbi:pirin family protein [Vogesella indigofera]|uniref:pirin family protein n=1 Tax=Vogesella indigofera TaxID=45465 RepID=UPI00234EB86E|nr:pirin family protein [Vogesella indigofera]MDC7707532.1 pirin family protein [Vogesella indigofera]
MTDPQWQSRTVEQQVVGMPTSDGAGVKLTRVLTQNLQRRLDPFLMLDEFRSDNPGDYIAGFPSHPHRGFETVTYMLAGRMRHRDSGNNEGLLGPGGVQWMTAGRGVIHSEMPEQEDGLMHGFQLWINLPAACKMIPAAYRDIPAAEIPLLQEADGVAVKVIAGQYRAQAGAIRQPDTEPLYLDLQLPAGGTRDIDIVAGHNAFVYVYHGSVSIEGVSVPQQRMAILGSSGDGVRLHSDDGASVLVLSGQPLREPIAQYGPFVMNTRAELEQAFADYQQGRLA